jgi:hypothetical protein
MAGGIVALKGGVARSHDMRGGGYHCRMLLTLCATVTSGAGVMLQLCQQLPSNMGACCIRLCV